MKYERKFQQKYKKKPLLNFCKIFKIGMKVRYQSKRRRRQNDIEYLPRQKNHFFVVVKLNKKLQKALLWNPETGHVLEKEFRMIVYHAKN